MKKQCKSFYLLLLLCISSAIAFAQLPADSIKKIIKTEVDNRRSKGIVVGIINEKGAQVFGYGKVKDDSNQQPDGNTLYEIGSITKVFTSFVLADMVQKGELKLSDPISKFLPKTVKTPVQNGKEITLLHLSTHTSGLPRMPDNFSPKDWANPYADYSVEQLYDFISRFKLTRDIGSKYEYSNVGVGLLGHILALKASVDYETLVRERICKPLKMNKTVITLTPELKSIFATGHDYKGNPVANWDVPALAGAGALLSNVNDLLLFLSANIGFTKTPLSSAMEQTHLVRDSTGPGNYIGLGWHIQKAFGTEITWHNGGTGGYRTSIGFDKNKKTGVVVLLNSANDCDDIALHILNSNYKLFPYQYKELLTDTMNVILNTKGVDAAIKLYHDIKKEGTPGYFFDEPLLNGLGYDLLWAKKIKEAIAIFKLNVEAFPTSFNVYDSYGEALMALGNKTEAIENYKKSVQLNPGNENGKKILKESGVNTDAFIKKVSMEYLKLLEGEYIATNPHPRSNREWKIQLEEVKGELTGNDAGYRYKLIPTADDTFVNPDDGARLVFDTKDKNAITFVLFGSTFKKVK